ncbi:GNAT family N-acetyltransferase [Paenibacillus sp. NPDC058071]|uniref:GNAT family N-acetyltransferase n=1 Tax=Paenibacillus sp. NPDC058071 TaxID=3346326 RepID=UPI0036DF64C4
MIDQSFLQGWAEFNQKKWNCSADLITLKAPNSDAWCETLILADRGKLILPPLNPYHLTVFHPTPTTKVQKTGSQWHEVAKLLAASLQRYKLSSNFYFPPEIQDIRPFLWQGFKPEIKYTYYVELPCVSEQISSSIRNKIKKANAAGYVSVRTDDMEAVHRCLAGTETRKGFDHHLTVGDLQLARQLLGEDRFRAYVCLTKDGEPVSASITMLLSPERALGWISASKTEHLSGGVVQQLQQFEFEDLHAAGVRTFDFYGANLESVSASKAHWGGQLRAFYGIRAPGYKDIVRSGLEWLRFGNN